MVSHFRERPVAESRCPPVCRVLVHKRTSTRSPMSFCNGPLADVGAYSLSRRLDSSERTSPVSFPVSAKGHKQTRTSTNDVRGSSNALHP